MTDLTPASDISVPQHPRVSVVICTRNRGDSVVETLTTVLANIHDSFELILVDQSTDTITKDAIEPFIHDSHFRYLPTPSKGLGRARNLGMSEAKGALVAFTDDDCSVPDNWLLVVEAVFKRNPRVGVVFCNVKAAPYDTTEGFIPAYERHDSALVRSMWGKCRARGIGAGIAVRREAVLSFGGFDENLGAGGYFPSCEDGDMAVRAILKNWWVYETHEVAVLHYGFRTWQQGKDLSKRDWVGIGAAYAKPLKCGHLSVLIIIFYELFMALRKPLNDIFHLRRPTGFLQPLYFLQGFVEALGKPVDRKNILFQL